MYTKDVKKVLFTYIESIKLCSHQMTRGASKKNIELLIKKKVRGKKER
jgi:hypothetical protein